MNWLRCEILRGEERPRCHGIAYMDFVRDSAITFLWPINHIASIHRRLWFKVRDAKYRDAEIQQIQQNANRELVVLRQNMDEEVARRVVATIERMIKANEANEAKQ